MSIITYVKSIYAPKHNELHLQNNKSVINKYPFNKHPFYEILNNPKYVHFYIDSDNIPTSREFTKFINYINTYLKPTFHAYSLAGYTSSQYIAQKYKIKYQPLSKRFISIHIVFYTTRVLYKYIPKYLISTIPPNILTHIDTSVYKSYQKFRHMLSPKYEHDDTTIGKISNKLKPHTQLITSTNNEHIINLSYLMKYD